MWWNTISRRVHSPCEIRINATTYELTFWIIASQAEPTFNARAPPLMKRISDEIAPARWFPVWGTPSFTGVPSLGSARMDHTTQIFTRYSRRRVWSTTKTGKGTRVREIWWIILLSIRLEECLSLSPSARERVNFSINKSPFISRYWLESRAIKKKKKKEGKRRENEKKSMRVTPAMKAAWKQESRER